MSSSTKLSFTMADIMRMKENREHRRSLLDERHNYILAIVAGALGLDLPIVEDAIMEGSQIEALNRFFAENGAQSVIFYYQNVTKDEKGPESARPGAQPTNQTSKSTKLKLFVTDGLEAALSGVCLAFTRTKPDIAITEKNIAEEVNFTILDTSEESSSVNGRHRLLAAMETIVSKVFVPSLERQAGGWGELEKNPNGGKIRADFIGVLSSFIEAISNAHESVDNAALLNPPETLDLSSLRTLEDYHRAASSTETLQIIDETMNVWLKQLRQIIAESDEIRREPDDAGPRDELEFWKRRTIRFNYLLDRIKSPHVKSVVGVLQISKSKLLTEWKSLDLRTTDIINEARDNVKFLMTLEKLCDPLYNSNPIAMLDSIPGLMNAIRMIYSISTWYNTSERITYLLVKVTNQMIVACKSYITDGGSETVWLQPTDVMTDKMNACLRLHTEYRAAFLAAKEHFSSDEYDRSFEFSQTLIFGKFDKFARRLNCICDIFRKLEMFSSLRDSKIEGVEALAMKLETIAVAIKQKTRNILDVHQTDFDGNFEEFDNNIDELQAALVSFMNEHFECSTSTQHALQLAQKFFNLGIDGLNVEEQYFLILERYAKDIETVAAIYEKKKTDPDVARDLPPVAGRISWARQLTRRVEQPMLELEQHQIIFKTNEAKKVVRNYNKLTKVLLEYEAIYYRCWLTQIDVVASSLRSSLIVRNEETGDMKANFDPQILTLFRETDCMACMGLEVPQVARVILTKRTDLKQLYDSVILLLRNIERVMAKISPTLKPLMIPHLDALNTTIEPGLNSISWLSVSAQTYIDDVYQALSEFELLVNRTNDLVEYRIFGAMTEMKEIVLCELPDDEPWSIEYFTDRTQALCREGANTLQMKSENMEEAVNELLALILCVPEETDGDKMQSSSALSTESGHKTPSEPQPSASARKRQRMIRNQRAAADTLVSSFATHHLEALTQLVMTTLEKIKRRMISVTATEKSGKQVISPIFRTSATLSVQTVTMLPTLDEVQKAMNQAVQLILDAFKLISLWSIDDTTPRLGESQNTFFTQTGDQPATNDDELNSDRKELKRDTTMLSIYSHVTTNYHRKIVENWEVGKLVHILSGSVTYIRKEIVTALDQFTQYCTMWEKDRDTVLKEFVATDPVLSSYEEKICFYEELEEQITSENDCCIAGPIAIFTDELKISLANETRAWRSAYGSYCNTIYRNKMNKTFEFIDDLTKRLSRPIKDLDDVRLVMASLRELRDNEVMVDIGISPIEESYAMLNKYSLPVTREEIERVDMLRYSWNRLQELGTAMAVQLTELEPYFRQQLLNDISAFAVECDQFCEDYNRVGPMVDGLPRSEVSDLVEIFQTRFETLWNRYEILSSSEVLFGLNPTEYPELVRIGHELKLLQKLYRLYVEVLVTINSYSEIRWHDVNVEKISKQLHDFQIRCHKLPRAVKELQTYKDLCQMLDDFNALVPLLGQMTNECMLMRHWETIEKITREYFGTESDDFVLGNVIRASLRSDKEKIEDVCMSAVKEHDVEVKLKQIIDEWKFRTFTLATFKARGEVVLSSEATHKIMSQLEDSIMMLKVLMNNQYSSPFLTIICTWIQNLSNALEITGSWMVVQNLWIYLDAVFSSPDVVRQLPAEAKRFSNIDKSWQRVIYHVRNTPNVVECCTGDDFLRQMLPHLLEQLELCQKSLTGHLEKKRTMFPRFYFISDNALLEILGRTTDHRAIESHLSNLFGNIRSLEMSDKPGVGIISVTSAEGESLPLDKPVKIEGSAESWLSALLTSSQSSVHTSVRDAALEIMESSFRLNEFICTSPTQICQLALQLLWTRDMTEALKSVNNDRKVMSRTAQKFCLMLDVLVGSKSQPSSSTSVELSKLETLLIVHRHQLDVFDELCRLQVTSPRDFNWQKQTRVYFDDDADVCTVSITDCEFVYQNEFLGCADRLVVTPLTERCFVAIAQAITMSSCVALTGPSGVGKTETFKDVGKCLGKFTLAFSSSSDVNNRGLERVFKGLATSGSWGCFENFDRVDVHVLSAAAQQISLLLAGRKEHREQLEFTDGSTITLKMDFSIFLTVSTADCQKFPKNFKFLFRSVALVAPDVQAIVSCKLFSFGFTSHEVLARKIVTLYAMCQEQLTKQTHYDFGLRNIASVLRAVSHARQKSDSSKEFEPMIIVHCLRDFNLTKLIDRDEPIFLGILADVFPGVIAGSSLSNSELEEAIGQVAEAAGLINHSTWTHKLIQLYEAQKSHTGVMLIGPSGSGKTRAIQTLMKALSDCGNPHREVRLNPKSLTTQQMFGHFDGVTREWTDGIFTVLFRRAVQDDKDGGCVWLLLDGPIDPLWLEYLQPTLDDNKTLNLANGDRIPLSTQCHIVFESESLSNASPATVARAGVVYMSSSMFDWQFLLKNWLAQHQFEEHEIFSNLFDSSFHEILQFAVHHLTFQTEVNETFILNQVCTLIDALIPQCKERKRLLITCRELYSRLYVFAVMWSIGGLMEMDERKQLEQFVRGHERMVLDMPDVTGDDESSIFDFFVETEGPSAGLWVHWDTLVDASTPRDSSTFLVPNTHTLSIEFLIDTMSKQNKPVLLIGLPGTAKTHIVNSYLEKLDDKKHVSRVVNFSLATTQFNVQKTMESFVVKRMGNIYGAPGDKKLTVFIDDVNLPSRNEWGDQTSSELLRQLLETKGFYSFEKPGEFTSFIDTQFLAAMRHADGSRHDIPQRLKRHFAIFNCAYPTDEVLDSIFGAVVSRHFSSHNNFSDEVQSVASQLVTITRRLWQNTKSSMVPTPAKFHYVFCPRDLSRIWQGVTCTVADTIFDVQSLISLWKHECCRELADRLMTVDDTTSFSKIMQSVCKEGFDDDVSNVDDLLEPTTHFVHFLRDQQKFDYYDDNNSEQNTTLQKTYEQAWSVSDLQQYLQMFQTSYNGTDEGSQVPLDLVFFEDAVTHLVRISRVVHMPRGHAVLIGVDACGKQSLARLASFIAGHQPFNISVNRSSTIQGLFSDLKTIYHLTGLHCKGVTCIVDVKYINDEILAVINSIICTGNVPGLFDHDEMKEIVEELNGIKNNAGLNNESLPTEQLEEQFLHQARSNLHVVACISPVSETFQRCVLKFPRLVSECTVDWFHCWPVTAYVAVADHVLSEFEIDCPLDTKSKLCDNMAVIHKAVLGACDNNSRSPLNIRVTFKMFQSFLEVYKTAYKNWRNEIKERLEEMAAGMDKMEEAMNSVAEMKLELVEKEKLLAIEDEKIEDVLQQLMSKAEEVETIRGQVQIVKVKAQDVVDSIEGDKETVAEKMYVAQPVISEAEWALGMLKESDLEALAKTRPPLVVMQVMDCILILLQRHVNPMELDTRGEWIKPSWNEAIKVLSSGNLLSHLSSFPIDTINDETIDLLKPYLDADIFDSEMAEEVCGNVVTGLFTWTKAMAKYFNLNKGVLPVKERLVTQEDKLAGMIEHLNLEEVRLDKIQKEMDVVRAEYEIAMQQRQVVVDMVEAFRHQVNAAVKIIEDMETNRQQWLDKTGNCAEQSARLIGDVLIKSAFLTYCGPFNYDVRQQLTEEWIFDMETFNIPHTEDLDIISMLSDSITVSEWNLQGLPVGNFFSQNGILVTKSYQVQFLFDPHSAARNWILKLESTNEIQVTSADDKHFHSHLENALSMGHALLVEEVGKDLDESIRNVIKHNKTDSKVNVNDKEIEIADGFRLYLMTRDPAVLSSLDLVSQVTVVNCSLSVEALEDHLLSHIIALEKPEIENQKVKLLQKVVASKRQIAALEADLLHRLLSAYGCITENKEFIDNMLDIKEMVTDIGLKLQILAVNKTNIETAREEWRHIAKHALALYQLVVSMSSVNHMYQMSVAQFVKIIGCALQRSEKSKVAQIRADNITQYLTYEVYRSCVIGFYEVDRMTFTLMLAITVDMLTKKIKEEEFITFVKGGSGLNILGVRSKPVTWIPNNSWLNLVALNRLSTFDGLLDKVTCNEQLWREWFDKENAEDELIPDGYDSRLDAFHRLLLVRSWFPERSARFGRKFVQDSLGDLYIKPMIVDLASIWQESDCHTPIVGLSSSGSDATLSIQTLAKKNKIELQVVYVGEDQEALVNRVVSHSMVTGGWVLLANCHLSVSCVNKATNMILTSESIHKDFRLWVTTEANEQFPTKFLQMSTRFADDQLSEGLKAGLRRTYLHEVGDQLDLCDAAQWKTLLYTMAFMHVTVQERRRFAATGSSVLHQCTSSASDFNVCIKFIQDHLDGVDSKKGIEWGAIRYMISEVLYGAHVCDGHSKNVLSMMCRTWFQQETLQPTFKFNSSFSVPTQCFELKNYLDYFDSMPDDENPEMFGLTLNADYNYQQQTTDRLFSSICEMNPRQFRSHSDISSQQAKLAAVRQRCDELLALLPDEYVAADVTARFQRIGALQPLNIFLRHEINLMQNVIDHVLSSLATVCQAIDGDIVMSEPLMNVRDALHANRVPADWLKISWESNSLTDWINELNQRNDQLYTWCFGECPKVFWLGGFFSPRALLTAVKQDMARKHRNWSMETVNIYSEVTRNTVDDITAPSAVGVYVHGLYLQNASWDRRANKLMHVRPKTQYEELPVIHLYASNTGKTSDQTSYNCPVYTKHRRTDANFVTNVALRTTADPELWVLRDTALLCNIK